MEHIDETKRPNTHPQAHLALRRKKVIPGWVIVLIAAAGVIGIFVATFFGGR